MIFEIRALKELRELGVPLDTTWDLWGVKGRLSPGVQELILRYAKDSKVGDRDRGAFVRALWKVDLCDPWPVASEIFRNVPRLRYDAANAMLKMSASGERYREARELSEFACGDERYDDARCLFRDYPLRE